MTRVALNAALRRAATIAALFQVVGSDFSSHRIIRTTSDFVRGFCSVNNLSECRHACRDGLKAQGCFKQHGTLDALLCKDGAAAKAAAAAAYISEAHRSLQPGGYFLAVSFGQPETRIKHITANAPWHSVVSERILIANKPCCYLYVATKATAAAATTAAATAAVVVAAAEASCSSGSSSSVNIQQLEQQQLQQQCSEAVVAVRFSIASGSDSISI
eukprot:8906-Heterococcus_DN1.PRE.4